MRHIPLLSSLPSPLWPRVVAPDKGPIYGSNRIKLKLRTSTLGADILMLQHKKNVCYGWQPVIYKAKVLVVELVSN